MSAATLTMPKSSLSRGAVGGVRTAKARAVTPAVDSADYANDTDYLYSIPGFVDELTELRNAPRSEFEDRPKNWLSHV